MSEPEKYAEYGLVDIASIDPSIKVELKYGTTDNFMHRVMYSMSDRAFAEENLARAVSAAQQLLKTINPSLSIIVYDAARPISIQRMMFDSVKGTPSERYVANPYDKIRGGYHNYGLAVDIAIVDEQGKMLDFGTGYDSFSELAHPGNEAVLVNKGLISMQAYENRMLLYYITAKQGLLPYEFEWWHYQLVQRDEDKQRYRLLDF
ncbi:MAG: M15 family metallopeptidase [Bacteroidales bacterium]|nr:M15 family metallopeptidase [Bacteroidales bacterium]